MLLVPISTDQPIRRVPVVNYALIGVNVLVFLVVNLFLGKTARGLMLEERMELWAESPQWYQFLTSMFMHADAGHLLGNMVFLWAFGNALNSKLGHVSYLLFYLACGLAAGTGYVLFENFPVVGASGAIFGVTAGFIVLFPLSRVTMFYWFFIMFGFWEINGLLVVGYFVAVNLYYLVSGVQSGVAYLAHLFGAVFGLTAALTLLVSGAVGRDTLDLLALVRRWRQRTAYQAYLADANNRAHAELGRVAQRVDELGRPIPSSAPINAQAERITQLRAQLGQAIQSGDPARAGQLFAELRGTDPEQVLPAKQQVDLGSYLMSDGQYESAAIAFESLLAHYPTYESIEQIELLLGLICGRYLNKPVRAKQYLEHCLPRLRDPNQIEFARRELDHASGMLRSG